MNDGFSDRDVQVGHLLGLRWFHLDTTAGRRHAIDTTVSRLDGHLVRVLSCRCGSYWDSRDSTRNGGDWNEWFAEHWGDATGTPVLSGAYDTWAPGENVAVCKSRYGHPAPTRDCRCGFWNYWALGDKVVAPPTVVGLVKGYGHIIQGELGFRASHAKIEALYCHVWDDAVALSLEATYEVPVYAQFKAMLLMHKPPEGQPELSDNWFKHHPYDVGRDYLTAATGGAGSSSGINWYTFGYAGGSGSAGGGAGGGGGSYSAPVYTTCPRCGSAVPVQGGHVCVQTFICPGCGGDTPWPNTSCATCQMLGR